MRILEIQFNVRNDDYVICNVLYSHEDTEGYHEYWSYKKFVGIPAADILTFEHLADLLTWEKGKI